LRALQAGRLSINQCRKHSLHDGSYRGPYHHPIWAFYFWYDVSASKVHEVVSRHIKSGPRGHIHQDISRFVTDPRETSFMCRGNDLQWSLRRSLDHHLIRQSCVPSQTLTNRRQVDCVIQPQPAWLMFSYLSQGTRPIYPCTPCHICF
jgi:hypothetical protein